MPGSTRDGAGEASRQGAATASAGRDPVIRARGISAGYGSVLAIRDVDLDVAPGEVVALLGPMGAGKTTTLLTLAGELRPSSGTVLWDGIEKYTPLHQRARGGLRFIPEDRSVFWRLSAAQNLAIQRPPATDSAVALFPELQPILSRRGGLLSGGEQRMLAVARALGSDARLLLADELSLGLAPKIVTTLLQAIRRAADSGLAALIVEQHVHRVLEIADRAYVMQRGRIRLAGSAADVAANLDEVRGYYLSGTSHRGGHDGAPSVSDNGGQGV